MIQASRHLKHLTILSLWIFLFYPVILWLARTFSGESFRFHFVVLIGILTLFLYRLKNHRNEILHFSSPSFRPLPFFIFLGSVFIYLWNGYFLKIQTLSAVLFGMGSYGLLGLFIPKPLWKKGWIPTVLLILFLPFENHLDIYLGFPLRIFSVDLIQKGLAHFNIQTLTRETILMIENSATQVDLSCSGLKGLWSGLIFFIALTWLERKRMNGYWVLLLFIFFFVLISTNLIRLTLLVLVIQVFHQPTLGNFIHLPLGMIGFIFSCLLIYYLLKHIPSSSLSKNFNLPSPISSHYLPWILIFILTLSGALYSFRPVAANRELTLSLQLPSEFHAEPILLTDQEESFFKKSGAHVLKMKFQWEEVSGSLLIVSGSGWRAHHDPKVCLEGRGFKIDRLKTVLMDDDFPVRVIDLNHDALTATSWFQSASQITEDFSARVWSELLGKENDWKLISLLFNGPIDPTQKQVQNLHLALRHHIQTQLYSAERTL